VLMAALGLLGQEMTNVALLMDPIQLMFSGFVDVAGPAMAALNEALVPVVGAVFALGRVLGMIMIPIFEMLGNVIEPLTYLFVFLYNNVLRPLAAIFIFITNIIRNLGQFITNLLSRPLAPWTWANGMIDPTTGTDIGTISVGDLTTAGITAGGDTTGDDTLGRGATFQQQRPIHVTVNVYDNQVFGGSLQDFGILIRDELLAIDELGL